MKILTTHENQTCIIKLSGRLDTTTAPELEKTVLEQADSASQMTFDLRELDYTSSAGLRVFLKARKVMNQPDAVRLINVSEDIFEILEMTGFTDLMTIEK